MELTTILGLCITATVLSVVLKSHRSEYAVAVSVAAGVMIFFSIISSTLSPIFEFRELIVDSGVSSAYFAVALKALGICIVSGFISDICRDFGQTALGNFAVAAGKSAIFVMSVPILTELLGAAFSFIG